MDKICNIGEQWLTLCMGRLTLEDGAPSSRPFARSMEGWRPVTNKCNVVIILAPSGFFLWCSTLSPSYLFHQSQQEPLSWTKLYNIAGLVLEYQWTTSLVFYGIGSSLVSLFDAVSTFGIRFSGSPSAPIFNMHDLVLRYGCTIWPRINLIPLLCLVTLRTSNTTISWRIFTAEMYSINFGCDVWDDEKRWVA